MKKLLTIVLTFCALMTAAAVQGQPLLKTHVETGDIEGVAEGELAVYKAIPYAQPPIGNPHASTTNTSGSYGRYDE